MFNFIRRKRNTTNINSLSSVLGTNANGRHVGLSTEKKDNLKNTVDLSLRGISSVSDTITKEDKQIYLTRSLLSVVTLGGHIGLHYINTKTTTGFLYKINTNSINGIENIVELWKEFCNKPDSSVSYSKLVDALLYYYRFVGVCPNKAIDLMARSFYLDIPLIKKEV